MRALRWLWWTIFDRQMAPLAWIGIPVAVLGISAAGLLGLIEGAETGYLVGAMVISAAALPLGIRRATRRLQTLATEDSRRP